MTSRYLNDFHVFEIPKVILLPKWNSIRIRISLVFLFFALHSFLFCKRISFSSSFGSVLSHSMARANLNKSVWLVTNTTAASKYIPRRPRISINWNPLFQTSLHKISEVIFFSLTNFFFRNKKKHFFSFLCIVKQKKKSGWSEIFWKFTS